VILRKIKPLKHPVITGASLNQRQKNNELHKLSRVHPKKTFPSLKGISWEEEKMRLEKTNSQ